ncbi:MAG: hypothetical protein KIH69_017180, partial [Anaerolineae bacterium]|nr:hypothetical protein [Anaerolineae bacterium]
GIVISTRSEKSLHKLKLKAYVLQRFLASRRNDRCYAKMTILRFRYHLAPYKRMKNENFRFSTNQPIN